MKWLMVCLFLLTIHNLYSQTSPLQSFPLSSVRLGDGPFQKAQQTDLHYILALDVNRLLVPFRREAGIETQLQPYGNWENSGLDGHIGGHYLSALSLMYAATTNEEILKRLNYMVDQLAECQNKNGNGYVGGIPGGKDMWQQIAKGKIDADNFSLNGKWVPLYNIHKLYAGLRDAYWIAGNKKALEVLIKLSDWFVNLTTNLSDTQLQSMLRSEHGGINEVFADVADITKDKKYLTMATRLSHQSILQPLLSKKDSLTGLHANTQIPKVIGYKRIADISGNKTWSDAAAFFWHTVVNHRTVSIGGNSVREHFHPAQDFSSMIESNQGPETCNTYNMLRLSRLLFLSEPDVKYLDYYERALYNHILSSQHPQGGFVYFTPMRPRHYRVYSQPQQSFWCCVGSGLENHGKYGELIYAHNNHDIYVNLFINATLEWKEKDITLTQQTDFPYTETSSITLKLKKPKNFTLYVRRPAWTNRGAMKIAVNGQTQKINTAPSSFVPITRTWKNGDVVTIQLPMQTTIEYLPDSSSWGTIMHGPIVLAAATDTSNLQGLRADDSRMGHVAEGPFYAIDDAPVLIKTNKAFTSQIIPVKNKPLTFTAANIIYPDAYKNVSLVPFFTLHESRYMIYWNVTTPENFEKLKQTIREKEKESLALEARTIDQVAPGEQQPESDHHLKGERTEMGNTQGQAWRSATGWFSYTLRSNQQKEKILRVTYAAKGRNRKFDILVNNKLLKREELTPSAKDTFYIDYEVPEGITANTQPLEVKFLAHDGHTTGQIYHVRLLHK